MTDALTFKLLLAVAEPTTPAEPGNLGIGAVVLAVAAAAVLGWMGYLLIAARRRKAAAEATPKNLQPFISDDEMESTRVTKVLNAAVIAAAVLAIIFPVYYVNESNRQDAAALSFEERNIEDGEHWFSQFSCINCHAAGGVGGGAPFVEKRSGLDTSWAAPSLNDVFYRYSESEVLYWVVNGRSGSPMPAGGLEGGGAMTTQEVDQVIDYLHSIQIPQSEALAKVEGAVEQALNRITGGTAAVQARIAEQNATIEDILDAPNRFAKVEEVPATLIDALAGDGTCTSRSAALVGASCGSAGADSDRDGLSDAAEDELNGLAAIVLDAVPVRNTDLELVPDARFEVSFDPGDAFSMDGPDGTPISDLTMADTLRREIDTIELNLRVTSERQDRFLENAQTGLAFLESALETKAWIPIGVEVVAEDVPDPADPGATVTQNTLDASGLAAAMDTSEENALRGLGLYNGYCARCHTAGYSAGVTFEQGPGSGAWAPALWEGRTVVQFPDVADHIDFIINGSEQGKSYGINGLGRGWMPGFGQVLSQEDIELIVAYERTL